MSTPRGKFYLTGLGLLMQGVRFTPDEEKLLLWLCEHAAQSDAAYWDAIQSVEPGSDTWHGIERLKDTFRRLGKADTLQAHYDRAA